MSYSDLAARTAQLAARLRALGIGAGDVVSMLLPTWWEAAVVFLAIQELGAIANPLHLTYREREITFILAQSGSRAVFTCGTHNGVDYASVVGRSLPETMPPTVIVVRGGGAEWASLPGLATAEEAPIGAGTADDIALLIYTSGTTADPKGVLHSHNTLLRTVEDMRAIYRLTGEDRLFVPSPVTHIAGLAFVLAALLCGGRAVLMDVWNEDDALDLVMAQGCSFAGGAMPFVRGLVEAVRRRGVPPEQIPLTRGNCGAADVPASLIADTELLLGAPFSRGYGLTEGILVSVCGEQESFDHRALTDGRIVPNAEVRLVDEQGDEVRAGQVGEIWIRGPQNFLGYLDEQANIDTYADDDWIRTGDLGRLVDGDYLVIVGRIKEMISRGGENISAREIEELLAPVPGIEEIAVIGMPDARLGEVACAVVRPSDGVVITLDLLVAHLRTAGIAAQKWPERFAIHDDAFPRTVSGKVRKQQLRQLVLQTLDPSPAPPIRQSEA